MLPTVDRVNMSWRDFVTRWISNRGDRLVVMDLVGELIRANSIPATLVDNATLHTILIKQALLETLNTAVLPNAPQGRTFTYHMNVKEEMMWSFGTKIQQHIRELQKETGVHLDHYHKLKIENMDIDCC